MLSSIVASIVYNLMWLLLSCLPLSYLVLFNAYKKLIGDGIHGKLSPTGNAFY